MHKTIRPRENILANINCTIKKHLIEWGILTKDWKVNMIVGWLKHPLGCAGWGVYLQMYSPYTYGSGCRNAEESEDTFGH